MAANEQEQAGNFAAVLELSSLFSNTVEAIGLIVPFHEGRKSESLLLAKIGIQQSRLLCWGDVLGVTSPPASTGITQAIPKRTGMTNPDPTQPIIFGVRDSRLDDAELRRQISKALNAILEPILNPDHTALSKTYGLRYYKAGRFAEQPLVNVLRLETFRERLSLLEDVSNGHKSPDLPRKRPRMLMPRWYIENQELFASYLRIMTENIDYLIKVMSLQPQVDKAMKMDIRAMGWHPSDVQVDISRMVWKLGIICIGTEDQYPEYSIAAKEALDNVLGVWQGDDVYQSKAEHNPVIENIHLHTLEEAAAQLEALKLQKANKGGFFGFKPKFLKKQTGKEADDKRSKSQDDTALSGISDAKRSGSATMTSRASLDNLDTPRSQSVHAMTAKEFDKAQADISHDSVAMAQLNRTGTSESTISRHDMYKGMYRIETKK